MNRMTLTLLTRSMMDRRFSLGLIVLALAAAVALYISVQNIQRMTRASFENSVANVDLVVAARSSDIQILLNAVFGIGETNSLMSADSVAAVSKLAPIAWHVPVSLGDSHKGFRVIGTTNDMFKHVLKNSQTDAGFGGVLEVVIGIDMASTLGYAVGDAIVLQHGVGDYGAEHDDLPFKIVHVLRRTGTPFDRVAFIPLQASEAIHRGWRGGQRLINLTADQVEKTTPAPHRKGHHEDDHHEGDHHEGDHHEGDHHEGDHHEGDHHEGDHHEGDHHEGDHHEGDHHESEDHNHAHGPSGIDAMFIGLKDKRSVVRVQRQIADYHQEALLAVIPGVTLARIWQVIGFADRGFMVINVLIIVLVLLSMVAMTALSADNRRREMAILRALGASPRRLVGLMIGEAVLLAVAAALFGLAIAFGLSSAAYGILAERYGLIADTRFYWTDARVALYLVPAAILANLVPAARLYRNSVSDGIMVKR